MSFNKANHTKSPKTIFIQRLAVYSAMNDQNSLFVFCFIVNFSSSWRTKSHNERDSQKNKSQKVELVILISD